jgi:hypothetical protein
MLKSLSDIVLFKLIHITYNNMRKMEIIYICFIGIGALLLIMLICGGALKRALIARTLESKGM